MSSSDCLIHRGVFGLSDGRLIAAAGFFDRFAVWPWIVQRVAECFECDEAHVACNDDDTISVRGKRVAVIESGPHVYAPCARMSVVPDMEDATEVYDDLPEHEGV